MAATNAPIPPGPKTAWRNISEPNAGHVGVLANALGLKAETLQRAVGAYAPHRNRPRLTPEPRPSTDAEPRLHSLVLLPIFQRCPDEQAADKNGGPIRSYPGRIQIESVVLGSFAVDVDAESQLSREVEVLWVTRARGGAVDLCYRNGRRSRVDRRRSTL